MDRDIEPTSPRKLRSVPADALLECGPDRNGTGPVAVLDIARARQDLAAHGLRVPDIDHLADELASGARVDPYVSLLEHDRIVGIAFVGSMTMLAGSFISHALFENEAMPPQPVWLEWAMAIVLALGALVSAGIGVVAFVMGLSARGVLPSSPRDRARDVLSRHVRPVELPPEYRVLIQRAKRAQDEIRGSEVWSTNFFDSHRVRIGLDEEVQEIATRLRRLTSIAHGAHTVGDSARQVVESTTARVVALEEYRTQVLECDRELKRLAAAETTEHNTDRLTDLLASTGADRSQIDNLGALAGGARAAAEAIRETLELMSGTAAVLAPSDKH